MADLNTLLVSGLFSHSSGSPVYAQAVWDAANTAETRGTISNTADEVYDHRIKVVTGGATTLGLTMFTSVNHAIFRNSDSTNFVTLTWDDANGDTNTLVIAAGKIAIIPDLDPSAACTVEANSATVVMDIFIDGQ
jgi:hypothetical protein